MRRKCEKSGSSSASSSSSSFSSPAGIRDIEAGLMLVPDCGRAQTADAYSIQSDAHYINFLISRVRIKLLPL